LCAQQAALSAQPTSGDEVSLIAALDALSSTYEVYFSYDVEVLKGVQSEKSSLGKRGLERDLKQLLKNTGLDFKKLGEKNYVIFSAAAKESLPAPPPSLPEAKDAPSGKQERIEKLNSPVAAISKTAKPATPALAQQAVTVSGRVLDENGLEMIGVTLFLKSNPGVGAVSEVDGTFSLEVPDLEQILVFSYVGYQNKEVPLNGQSQIEVQMTPNSTVLDQVVVTALGVEKSEKSLGYSTQLIQATALETNSDPNFLNKLSGQVAGLQVSPSANGPGGSVRVLIRGSSSLTGQDEPIYVIDGVVISNTAGNNATANGGLDYGNAAGNINPEDIESITVLKGAGAAALYGSLAQNGAIVITTKSGSARKGIGVNFSTAYTLEQPFLFPEFQNEFGRGARGVYTQFNQDSWGPRYDGQVVTNWREEDLPFEAVRGQMQDFFKNGHNLTNNLELTAGNNKSSTRFAINTLRYTNTIPNSDFSRNSITLRHNSKMTDFLELDGKVNFINQQAFNRLNLAGSPDNPTRSFYLMPRSVRLGELLPYIDEQGFPYLWDGRRSGSFDQNPYWAINLNTNEDTRNRVISSMALNFTLLPWLKGHLRAGADYILDRRQSQVAEKTAYKVSPDAAFNIGLTTRYTGNYDFLLRAQKVFGDFDLSLSLGGNRLEQKVDGLNGSGDGLNNPDLYVINNFVETFASQGISNKRINSFYAFSDIAYKNFLYLSLTARNDWSSALPAENRSFYYSSANLSWVLSDMWEDAFPNWFDFAKLRLSYANVGNDTDPHRLNFIYASTTGHLGQAFTRLPRERPPLDLLPENTRSLETGFDLRFFRGSLNLDFTWYKSNTFNQIFAAPVASTSGFQRALINAGEVQNSGIEVQLRTDVFKGKRPYNWDISVNYAANVPEVISLNDEVERLVLAGSAAGLSIQGIAGNRNDLILGSRALRNAEGQLILDEFGLPQVEIDENGNSSFILGHVQPDFTIGLRNSFSFKGLTLGFLLDAQLGGSIYSSSQAAGSARGTLANTLEGRDDWYESEADRIRLGYTTSEWIPTGGLLVEGVDEQGSPLSNNFVDPQRYWSRMAGIDENFVFDASFIRLNEITLGYQLPKQAVRQLKMQGIGLSVFVNNALFLKKHTPGFAPQSSYSSGKAQGIESFAYPLTRSFGGRVSVSF
jgi:TonB-linked SusC/RagA family outer membrane protein